MAICVLTYVTVRKACQGAVCTVVPFGTSWNSKHILACNRLLVKNRHLNLLKNKREGHFNVYDLKRTKLKQPIYFNAL